MDYEDISHLDDHTSSIVAVKFGFDPKEKEEAKWLKIISSGADKTIIYRNFDESKNEDSLYHKEVFKNNKIVSMNCIDTKIVAGHDKLITVSDLSYRVRVFEKKPEKIKA
jgi:hypothetical protein